MSSEVSKLKMKTANARPQRMPITTQCIGTTDFFLPRVVSMQEVVPGENVKLDTICSIQGKPMAMPAEVQLKHSLRAFYVPQRVISKDWLSYITDRPFSWTNYMGSPNNYAIHEKDAFTYNEFFLQLFCSNDFGMTTQVLNPTEDGKVKKADIYLSLYNWEIDEGKSTAPRNILYNLTNKGRTWLAILNGLGYEINWAVKLDDYQWQQEIVGQWVEIEDENGNIYINEEFNFNRIWPYVFEIINQSDRTKEDEISIKPLLAYIKLMFDWYWPSEWEQEYKWWFENIKEYQFWNTATHLDRIIDQFEKVSYEVDYFTAAWKNPAGPNDNENFDIRINDPTQHANNGKGIVNPMVIGGDGGEAPAIRQFTSDVTEFKLSKYLLNALDAVNNYMTRNRIAGYRPVDRFLAQFGVHLNYIQTGRSQYLGGRTINLNISQIVAQAETAGAEAQATGALDQQLLGGKGAIVNGLNKLHTEWRTEEHGYIIVIQTIIPRIGYYQGIKPWCTRVDKMKFYNGTFDNLGVEAIPRQRLFHAKNSIAEYNNLPTNTIPKALFTEKIWGWSGTYMDYKVGFDVLLGDYRYRTLNEGIESMHSYRVISDDGEDIPANISLDFVLGQHEQYDRLFAYTGGDVDHFYFTVVNRNHGTKPMKSASETLDITDGEGNYTEFEVGGSYMN